MNTNRFSIIDKLLLEGCDADLEETKAAQDFNAASLLGYLSEAQIAFGRAIMANPAKFTAARDSAEAKLTARHEANVAAETAKAERAAARKTAGRSARQLKMDADYATWVAAGRPAKVAAR